MRTPSMSLEVIPARKRHIALCAVNRLLREMRSNMPLHIAHLGADIETFQASYWPQMLPHMLTALR